MRRASFLLVCLTACAAPVEEGALPRVDALSRVVVATPDAPAAALALTADQVRALLDGMTTLPVTVAPASQVPVLAGTLVVALGPSVWSEAVVPAAERQGIGAEGYRIRRGLRQGIDVLAAVGPDALGEQYAAYALLERLGVGFFHPEDTYVPGSLTLPASLDVLAEPRYGWRGFHLHTMHPIELMDSFLVPGEEHLAEAQRYIDWLVMNRQDYLQWVLQDTVDMEAWLPHAAAIVDYAHLRGIAVGIDAPFRFIQQNGWTLAPYPVGDWKKQIDARVALLMEVPWDVLNTELGASEFFPEDDVETMDMMNYTADLLDRVYGVELIVKVHCSTGQTAPSYGDINYNFLPGLADPRVGVLPHTVQLYDLYRPAPTYDNADFSAIREFLLDEIGERRVLYYPETAYWVSFDVDVPLYLPQYVYSRWNDLHRLDGSGMDGQVNFSSGFEWGYWMNDWASAAFAFDPRGGWEAQLARFTRIFGEAAVDTQALLEDVVEAEGADFVEGDLLGYLIGQDVADDFGYLVGIHAQPERVLFHQIRQMDEATLLAFEADVVARLGLLSDRWQGFRARAEALEARAPAASARWLREIRRGIAVTALRAEHSRRLVEGVCLRREDELGLNREGDAEALTRFTLAQLAREEAETLIGEQEAEYRWPADRIARRRDNPTSYEFGYLYPVSDAYHWRRDELKAIDEVKCPCVGNITNQLATLFGEGHPLEELVAGLPPLPLECVDRCVHPIDSIAEEGGSQ